MTILFFVALLSRQFLQTPFEKGGLQTSFSIKLNTKADS